MRRVLKITTNDGQIFFSADWGYELVSALEQQALARHAGVKSMELIEMSEQEYGALRQFSASAELFRLPWSGIT